MILGRRKNAGIERGRFVADPESVLELAAGREAPVDHTVDFEQALDRLPAGAREVFLLHDVAGYRHEEIAKLLGIVPGTSKSQLHHARMALRKHLD